MCGCTIVHVTNFNQNDHRNHDYQIISIVDPLPCHVSIHKHITSTNCLSEWYTQYTPKAKPTLFPEHKFKLAIGSKVQNPHHHHYHLQLCSKAKPKKHGQSQQRQQHRSLHLLDLRHQILLWQRPSSPMAPVCLSLSLSLWVALLMVLKSKTVWHFVYTEGSERWRIRCLRRFWTRSCHGFCRSARRPSIPIAVTKTTYDTSAFGYSWYFISPSLFLFFLFFIFFLMISILGRWVS